MRIEIGCVALLLGAFGIVTCAAASENAAGVAGKRGPLLFVRSARATTGGEANDSKKKQKGKSATLRPGSGQGWLSDFLGINPPPSLADSTGLNVTTPTVEEAKQPFVERRTRASVAPDGTKLLNDR